MIPATSQLKMEKTKMQGTATPKQRAELDGLHEFAKSIARYGWRLSPVAEAGIPAAVLHFLSDAELPDLMHQVFALESILIRAIDALGDNPRADAARLLFGVVPETKGRLRKHRRGAAARAMGLAEETFAKHYEKEIVADLAVELYRLLVVER